MTTAFAPTETSRETPSVDFRAMGSDWHVVARGISEEALAQVSMLVEREERRCSPTRPDSLLSQLNRERGVTDGMLALLTANALAIREATAGAFDPAVGDAVLAAAAMCEPGLLAAVPGGAIEHPCAETLQVTVDGQDVRPDGAGQLDLGGIDKGWTADLVSRYLRGTGASQWLISVGGDIVIGGDEAKERLIDVKSTELTIGLSSGAVATSSMLKRVSGEPSERNHQIIDPASVVPADHDYVMATVIASSAAIAAALATAMLADPERGDRALASHEAEVVLVTRNGDAFMSPGIDRHLR